jgi:hypothetical protein
MITLAIPGNIHPTHQLQKLDLARLQFILVVGSDHKSSACSVVTRNATSVGDVFA